MEKNRKKKLSNYEPLFNTDESFSFFDIPQPTFFRSFIALVKRSFFIRTQISSSLFSIFLMPFYILTFTEFEFGTKTYVEDIRHPKVIPLTSSDPISDISNIMKWNKKNAFVVTPDSLPVRSFFQDSPFFNKILFMEQTESVIDKLYKSSVGVGIKYFDIENKPMNPKNQKISILLKDFSESSQYNLISSLLLGSSNQGIKFNISKSEYANRSNHQISQFSSDSFISMVIMMSFVSVILQEVRLYHEDKSNKVLNLIFINRCSHLYFWASTIVVSLCACVPSCLIITYFLTSQEEYLNDSDFSLVFTFFILFSLSLSLMLFSLSKYLDSSRTFKNFFTIFSLAFSLINNYLQDHDSKYLIKMISIGFPQFVFSRGLSIMLISNRSNGPIHWKDVFGGNNSTIFWILITMISGIFFYIFILIISELYCLTRFKIARLRRLFEPCSAKLPENGTFIKVKNLSKFYGNDTIALDNVSYDIQKGDFVVQIGPNGSGKSTMIDILTGVIKPDHGGIGLFGEDFDEADPEHGFDLLAKYVGICFQENVLIPQLTVSQHLYFFGSIYGMPYSMLSGRINKIIDGLDLGKYKHTKSSFLSGGSKRKLCIALAILVKPPILILDEPTAGVDINSRQKVWNFLRENKASVCFITSHSLEEAENAWNKLFVLKDGKLKFNGTEGEARSRFMSGYLLKTVNGRVYDENEFILELRKRVEADVFKDISDNSFIIPDNDKIGNIFDVLDEFQITQYTLSLQALEDIILKYYEDDSEENRTKGNVLDNCFDEKEFCDLA